MSENQEFYAATVEEAVKKASVALGVSTAQLRVEILDQGSSGFLGIGARDARILVEYSEPQVGVPMRSSENQPPETADESQRGTLEEKPRDLAHVDTPAGLGGDDTGIAEHASEDLILAIDEFATALVDAMGLNATIDAYDAGDVIAVDVATEETGLFIGQKGETIDAIQYLLNVAVYKNRPFVKRIVVDSEGYRQRRVEAIQGMAHRTARRAVRERRPLTLPPMPAAERRVVHLFLKENPLISTSSEGKEEDRRVVVSPIQ